MSWVQPPNRLSDPAFSPDPRDHPLAHAASYRASPPTPVTARHHLDSIDELDETDPFGASYHHDGPYEAIATNLALPPTDSDAPPRSMPEFNPRSLRPGRNQLASRVPLLHSEPGLSLHLEPGQILQQNTVYASFTPSMASVPRQSRPQQTIAASATRPNHSQRTRSSRVSLDPPDDPQKRLSSLRAPPELLLRVNIPDASRGLDDLAPNAPHPTEMSIVPPPRHESKLHGSDNTRSPQHAPLDSMAQKTQAAESAASLHPSRHRSVRSLDSSHTTNNVIKQPSLTIQHKPLEPPRIRHLPKRLVMPAPLQPQQRRTFSLSESTAWQDDDHGPERAYPGKPGRYIQESGLLRRRSSAFPAKEPIPDHVPMSQEDAAPLTASSSTKMATEGVETKERTRRRKLSKRKNDG